MIARIIFALVVLAIFPLRITTADADMITFHYSGIVTTPPNNSDLRPLYPENTPVKVSYTVDSTTPADSRFSTATTKFYTDAVTSATIELGPSTFTLRNPGFVLDFIRVSAQEYSTVFSIEGLEPTPGWAAQHFSFSLVYTSPVFPSPFAMPTVAPDPLDRLVGNRNGAIAITFRQGNGAAFDTLFTNASVSPVPLPPSVMLFGAGLLGLIAWRWRPKGNSF